MASFYPCGPLLPKRSSRLSTLKKKNRPSPLIYLLDEIWTVILKKLTQNEALNLRRVNNDFKEKIDNLYEDWVINLDDSCPYLNMILDLRVKKLTVTRLLNPIANRPPGILKFPDLLQKIDVHYYPDIIAENLDILLSQCKNLKSISIEIVSDDVFWKKLDPLVGYNFSELHTLNINFRPCWSNNFYEYFLTRSKMPKLQSLEVGWIGTQYPAASQRLTSTLFSFMGRHGQTLKHFAFHISHSTSSSELIDLDESALQNCSNLETFKISSFAQTDYLLDKWRRLIEKQTKLTALKIFAYVPISRAMWARVCENNFRTLTKFEFHGRRVESEPAQYDLSVFRKCVNLKHFEFLIGGSTGEFFCNFATLPDQIETVIVYCFLISSEEFVNFLKSHHSLLSLEICSVADEREFGVNSSVLKGILNHDSLKSVKILDDCITKPNSRTELTKLKKTFSDLGCTMAWNELYEFTLEKSSDSNTWVAKNY